METEGNTRIFYQLSKKTGPAISSRILASETSSYRHQTTPHRTDDVEVPWSLLSGIIEDSQTNSLCVEKFLEFEDFH